MKKCIIKSIKGVQVEAGGGYADRLTAQDLYEKDPKEFDIRQKMLYNKNADKEQLARYKKGLAKTYRVNSRIFRT